MRQFSVIIPLIFLIIDNDNLILAKPKDVVKNETNLNSLEDALENLLKVGVKQLDLQMGHRPNNKIYKTEEKKLLFVKKDSAIEADKKYRGEFEGLIAIQDTKTITVPQPIAIGHTKNNIQHFIVMEFMNLTALNNITFAELGSQVADMHMCNWQPTCRKQPIKQFGFHIDTYSGFVHHNNTWTNDWITFFIENRLGYQINLMQSSSFPSTIKQKVIEDYWPRLKPLIPKFFEGIDIKPSLLHGDLWAGNVGVWNSKPVVFDPAAFYGHYEFDIASTTLFGGYLQNFYDAYFDKITKLDGFSNRIQLYRLFNFLNHWNHYEHSDEFQIKYTFERLLKVYK